MEARVDKKAKRLAGVWPPMLPKVFGVSGTDENSRKGIQGRRLLEKFQIFLVRI
jgi:hypothetical protein